MGDDDWRDSSPMATRRSAEEYEDIARAGLQSYRSKLPENQRHHSIVPFAIFANFGRAIELGLKSFLMHKGIPASELRSRRKYGHDLHSCLDTAIDQGLLTDVNLSGLHREVIGGLSGPYCEKLFDYPRIGSGELTHVDQVAAVTRELLGGLSKVPYKPVKPTVDNS